MFTQNFRPAKRASWHRAYERGSSSAKVENRHGSLGNKMRAPALPWGWGPLDNPYCTPHPLVLPPSRSSLAPPPLAVYTPIGRKSFVRACRAREKSHRIYLPANRVSEISQKWWSYSAEFLQIFDIARVHLAHGLPCEKDFREKIERWSAPTILSRRRIYTIIYHP